MSFEIDSTFCSRFRVQGCEEVQLDLSFWSQNVRTEVSHCLCCGVATLLYLLSSCCWISIAEKWSGWLGLASFSQLTLLLHQVLSESCQLAPSAWQAPTSPEKPYQIYHWMYFISNKLSCSCKSQCFQFLRASTSTCDGTAYVCVKHDDVFSSLQDRHKIRNGCWSFSSRHVKWISKFCTCSAWGRSVYGLYSCGILNTAAVCVSSLKLSVYSLHSCGILNTAAVCVSSLELSV